MFKCNDLSFLLHRFQVLHNFKLTFQKHLPSAAVRETERVSERMEMKSSNYHLQMWQCAPWDRSHYKALCCLSDLESIVTFMWEHKVLVIRCWLFAKLLLHNAHIKSLCKRIPKLVIRTNRHLREEMCCFFWWMFHRFAWSSRNYY